MLQKKGGRQLIFRAILLSLGTWLWFSTLVVELGIAGSHSVHRVVNENGVVNVFHGYAKAVACALDSGGRIYGSRALDGIR